MVLRFVGLIGLTLLPFTAAAEPAVHQALAAWLADGGSGTTRYKPVTATLASGDQPRWLLRPAGADALSRRLLDRGLYPEAVSLDWREGTGPVLVFGARHPGGGFRLLVDRDRQRPVALETGDGVRWRFLDYRSTPGRRTGLPGRLVRLGPEGDRTVYTPTR